LPAIRTLADPGRLQSLGPNCVSEASGQLIEDSDWFEPVSEHGSVRHDGNDNAVLGVTGNGLRRPRVIER